MTATLTIKLSDEVLEALRGGKAIHIRMATPARRGEQHGGGGDAQPRPGTLAGRLIDWASGLGRSFQTADVGKHFKLTRAHASMLMSKLAGGAHPIRRVGRGVYRHSNAGAGTGQAAPREGSLPARILDWAQARGGSFGVPDVVREFGIKRGHASMEMSKLANGARPIRRTGRGVYEYAGAGESPGRRRKTVKKRK